MNESKKSPPQPPAVSGSFLPPAWEALFEAIEDGVCVKSPDGVIIRANRAFASLIGLPPAQIIGQPCAEIMGCEHALMRHLCACARSAATREEVREEISGRLPGQRLLARVSQVLDDDGVIMARVMVVRDITDIIAQEREMSRVEHLARFSELAAGLAHEIKNPLAGIQGAMDILLQRSDVQDSERNVLERVRHEVGRIDATINTLLERARPRGFSFRPASLNDTLQRAIGLARHQAAGIAARTGQQISVELIAPTTPVFMLFDPAQIEDAVLSLLFNAIEAIDGDGAVVARLHAPLDRNTPETEPDGTPYEVCLEISDNGRGIPAADMPHIFSPFFTTNPYGTGLGLPAVRRIVRAHGGIVEVRSTVNRGSVFTIRLPYRTPTQPA